MHISVIRQKKVVEHMDRLKAAFVKVKLLRKNSGVYSASIEKLKSGYPKLDFNP